MASKPDGLLKGGLIANIILSIFGIISSLTSMATFESIKEIDIELYNAFKGLNGLIVLFGIIVPAITILISAFAFKNKKYKIAAGVLGVITNLIGGILVLCGKYTDSENM